MEFLEKNRRFSFKLDGADGANLNFKTDVTRDGNKIITEYTFDGGLRITNIATEYEKFGAYEWVNYIENTSDKPSGIISELWDCDCTLPLEHEDEPKCFAEKPDPKTATKIYAPNGSNAASEEFLCDIDKMYDMHRTNHILVGQTKKYAAKGGRSSSGAFAPFFNIHKNGKGYIAAIGWSGQWNCEITRLTDGVRLKTKIEDTNFRVMPGEKFRTSSVVILPYEANAESSQNIWRRLVKEHFSPKDAEGKNLPAPLCASVWGGMPSDDVIERVNALEENEIPVEYIWMDAGWYGKDTAPTPDEFEGDWPQHNGDWRVSEKIHPNGLRDVSEVIHKNNLKFLLWFEPERVVKRVARDVPFFARHPEYLLESPEEEQPSFLLDLGNEKAYAYCRDMLCDMIDSLKIDCYRNDFNFDPLPFWRAKDSEDRRGISEIKYINGLYRLWDELRTKFPNLLIDNCASGGKRIDIELLRRSMPLWRSDFQCPKNPDVDVLQCHAAGFGSWMPFSGTDSGKIIDEYSFRSSHSPALTTMSIYSKSSDYKSAERMKKLKKYVEEYITVRPYLSEDFYPLTEPSHKDDVWCAMQYDRPEKRDGVVEIFRRENSPYETARFHLRGIDKNASYLFCDADGGEFEISGSALFSDGLEICIKEKRKAKIYFYKAV